MTNWDEWLGDIEERPFMVCVIGDIGQGKTVTCNSIVDHYKDKLQPVIIGHRSVIRNYPDWFKKVNYRDIKIPRDAIVFIDDIHLYWKHRDWASGRSKLMGELARERRHVNTCIVMSTQEARVVDVDLVTMLSALIVKLPSKIQRQKERSEIKPELNRAYNALKGQEVNKAYIIQYIDEEKEEVIDINLPSWHTEEISKAHRDYFGSERKAEKSRSRNTSVIRGAGEMLKMIGRAIK